MSRSLNKVPGGYEYTLGAWLYTKLKNKGQLVCCYCNCLKALKLGDRIVSKTRRGKARRYHKDCWKQTFVA
jgi:hypothetical protein